jgi:hypothetical protein
MPRLPAMSSRCTRTGRDAPGARIRATDRRLEGTRVDTGPGTHVV